MLDATEVAARHESPFGRCREWRNGNTGRLMRCRVAAGDMGRAATSVAWDARDPRPATRDPPSRPPVFPSSRLPDLFLLYPSHPQSTPPGTSRRSRSAWLRMRRTSAPASNPMLLGEASREGELDMGAERWPGKVERSLSDHHLLIRGQMLRQRDTLQHVALQAQKSIGGTLAVGH